MVRYYQTLSCFLVIMFLLGFYAPVSVAEQKDILLQKLNKKITSPELKRKAMFAGEERALICGYCHGNDGNSLKPEVPNLAGQNPAYLLQQIGHFASGARKDFVMNSLASKLTEDDQINLAIFYTSQKVRTTRFDKARAVQGKRLYLKQCQGCHGVKGRGKTGYARLAGQQPVYIKMTLQRFRGNTQSKTSGGKRRSAIMEAIVTNLADKDIESLAAYIASM